MILLLNKKERTEKQQRVQERINQLNSMPNFLFIVEAKTEETKKFLEDIGKRKEKYDIHEDGTVFVRNQENKIVDVTTITKLCKKLAEEVKGIEPTL